MKWIALNYSNHMFTCFLWQVGGGCYVNWFKWTAQNSFGCKILCVGRNVFIVSSLGRLRHHFRSCRTYLGLNTAKTIETWISWELTGFEPHNRVCKIIDYVWNTTIIGVSICYYVVSNNSYNRLWAGNELYCETSRVYWNSGTVINGSCYYTCSSQY